MSTYEFEVIAKNAVIKLIQDKFGEEYTIGQINVVWMAHVLGYKKVILIDSGENTRMYEVTYNLEKNELYADVYVKVSNTLIPEDQFDLNVPA